MASTAPVAFLPLFLRLKLRLANNHLSGLRRHLWIHLVVGLLVVFMLIGGGSTLFHLVFRFLMEQQPFGPPLMDRLIRMVLLAFFSMLIFSNLIIMLTTTYISREVEFLMAQPIPHRRLFFAKLGESIVYSSWAFVILAFPLFVALRSSRDLPWTYFPSAACLLIPYLIIPAAAGAALALVIAAFFPPRRIIRFTFALGVLGMVMAVAMQRSQGVMGMMRQASAEDTADLMSLMDVGDFFLLPSGWLGHGLVAIEHGFWREAGFWALALWSTAAMGLVVCDWLAGLYYRGWTNARSSAAARRRRRAGLYGLFDRLLGWMPAATRAMVTKDLTVFWRDPAQWGQLVMLFGLLFIYLINLRSAAGFGQFQIFIPFWQSIISLFNIGATAFVLSILTTRFVYPMLSLEGKQQWVIGLAPVARTRIVWEKFIVSWISAVGLTTPLALLSSFMLRTEPFVTLLTVATVAVLAIGLSSMAVGLGALLPNFAEDNPSRIANGVGGTLNAILSLIYIGATLALETIWVHAYLRRGDVGPLVQLLLWGSFPVWLLLQLGTAAIPLTLGLRRWRRMEF
ncbi:MAG TPA: hypothetical protein PK847_13295 [Candidatus Sumerlaeota bacterium]|nr:hypothetical protein [Candidatus Sumerlaeota bacterium]